MLHLKINNNYCRQFQAKTHRLPRVDRLGGSSLILFTPRLFAYNLEKQNSQFVVTGIIV